MYILIDFSQIVFSTAISYYNNYNIDIDFDLLKSIVYKILNSHKNKFCIEQDDRIILCFDSIKYWRRDIFFNYKRNRIKKREDSRFNWSLFFKNFNKIKSTLKEEQKYICIEVQNCEADDIIYVISKVLCNLDRDVLIISSDRDLLQIQKTCFNVTQWNPFSKKYIDSDDYNLFEHICKGDKGDGIPNILSDDDVYISGGRSKTIRLSSIKTWEIYGIENLDNKIVSNFNRNRTLIDFNYIPEELCFDIACAFVNSIENDKKLVRYKEKHNNETI